MKYLFGFVTVLLGVLPFRALSHGDLHERIQQVTALIEKEPRQAELYLRRGELHRAHEEWDAAQADFDRVQSLEPKLVVVDLARGKLFLEAGWPLSAQAALDRFLSRQPDNPEALTLRGRVLVKLGQRVAASRDFTAAIVHSPQPDPELFVARAQALTGEGSAYYEDALKGLEEGIKRLGPLVALELFAMDVELKQKQYDAALRRLDKVAVQIPRQETWLARRGEILQQAGRSQEAIKAYQASLTAMDKLPAARRNVPAMVELAKRVRAALEVATAATSQGKRQ